MHVLTDAYHDHLEPSAASHLTYAIIDSRTSGSKKLATYWAIPYQLTRNNLGFPS